MMIKIGSLNRLSVVKQVDFGVYLDGGEYWQEILLPKRYIKTPIENGDEVEVFIYFDSEDRIVATTDYPKAAVGEFAYLQVTDVNRFGIFLDWGLPKDLFVPYKEQARTMHKGSYYLVKIYQDNESERICASSKINKFLNKELPAYEIDEQVELIIVAKTDLGYKAIVDNSFLGMLYADEVFESLKTGKKLTGFIKKVRKDNKIDLYLKTINKKNISELEKIILDNLDKNNGVLYLSDKTSAENIYKTFKVSKKNYKRALGGLYKKNLIKINDNFIEKI